jgi:hypothetical protein
MYTHGGCFVPGQVHPFTTIGRYCSIAGTVRIINRNHPLDFKSTHAMFCISRFKFCDKDLVGYTPLNIGNDVWIGHNAIITPNVRKIGDGAVIAAGAVVNKDAPPYAVIVGNPARIVRYRFPQEIIDELLASKWWEKDIEELKSNIKEFQQPYERIFPEERIKKGAKETTNEEKEHAYLRQPKDTNIERSASAQNHSEYDL